MFVHVGGKVRVAPQGCLLNDDGISYSRQTMCKDPCIVVVLQAIGLVWGVITGLVGFPIGMELFRTRVASAAAGVGMDPSQLINGAGTVVVMGIGYNMFVIGIVCMALSIWVAVLARDAYRELIYEEVDRGQGDAFFHMLECLQNRLFCTAYWAAGGCFASPPQQAATPSPPPQELSPAPSKAGAPKDTVIQNPFLMRGAKVTVPPPAAAPQAVGGGSVMEWGSPLRNGGSHDPSPFVEVAVDAGGKGADEEFSPFGNSNGGL